MILSGLLTSAPTKHASGQQKESYSALQACSMRLFQLPVLSLHQRTNTEGSHLQKQCHAPDMAQECHQCHRTILYVSMLMLVSCTASGHSHDRCHATFNSSSSCTSFWVNLLPGIHTLSTPDSKIDLANGRWAHFCIADHSMHRQVVQTADGPICASQIIACTDWVCSR